MTRQSHWEDIYTAKSTEAMSWYQERLSTSLDLILGTNLALNAEIIDVGGGASTLADDLWRKGYRNVSVLDISRTALEKAKQRLGSLAERIHWIEGDITQVELPANRYDLWHDRAVFHFLTTAPERKAYQRAVMDSVKSGGAILIATFSLRGPAMCSGLPVQRYDSASLASEFPECDLIDSRQESHRTPAGAIQDFTYALLKRP